MIADLASLVVRRPHEERQRWVALLGAYHASKRVVSCRRFSPLSKVFASVQGPPRKLTWQKQGVGKGPKTNSWSGKAWWRIGMSSSKSLEWADPGYRSTAKPCEQTLLRRGRTERYTVRLCWITVSSMAPATGGAPTSQHPSRHQITKSTHPRNKQLDDGWPESEKRVFQASLSVVVVKNSRWMVGEVSMSYGRIWREKR